MNLSFDQIMINVRRGIYKYIGGGSSREVYDLNNGYVVKLAKNRAGIAQNRTEYKIYFKDNTDIFARIIDASYGYECIIMRKAKKINSMEQVWRYFNVSNKREFDNLEIIQRLKYKYNLIIADINRASSWGIINGEIVIIDYGYTREVRKKYY